MCLLFLAQFSSWTCIVRGDFLANISSLGVSGNESKYAFFSHPTLPHMEVSQITILKSTQTVSLYQQKPWKCPNGVVWIRQLQIKSLMGNLDITTTMSNHIKTHRWVRNLLRERPWSDEMKFWTDVWVDKWSYEVVGISKLISWEERKDNWW